MLFALVTSVLAQVLLSNKQHAPCDLCDTGWVFVIGRPQDKTARITQAMLQLIPGVRIIPTNGHESNDFSAHLHGVVRQCLGFRGRARGTHTILVVAVVVVFVVVAVVAAVIVVVVVL